MKKFVRRNLTKIAEALLLIIGAMSILLLIVIGILIINSPPPPDVELIRFEREAGDTNATLIIKNYYNRTLTVVEIHVDVHRNGYYVSTNMTPSVVLIEAESTAEVKITADLPFRSRCQSRFKLITDDGRKYECLTYAP